ncbi:methyl-accepting chemotaxis sensory transducer with Pas/Pac sensor [Methanospirillum hungatei JF-1]|uniref:Methyl-accepting chemotaxis sensory transducer with Pas/Pac sensor n=1 Tax=Methanospirillum hungatei JF-1 (strain ATCC 27890 / DSM 864 / NBRC 100397 / JF-1) TaxID=323259 RepID=Q2FP17_METHJ|nr:methyl-accepting chemotaxis protein [Methanospirillum hungatei]ABD41143.1 methyl-accepting chemotaxis sensory transducer with Pas/Pac sensor [Methanospirillum hungatei JF-1]
MNGKTRTSDIASLQNILDATSSSIQIIGPEGVYIDCNAATYAMFRANTVEDIIGKPPSILSPEKQRNGTDSNEGAAQFIQMAFSGEVVSFEWEHKRLDGSIFPCQVTLQLIEYEGKTCLMATIVDITDVVALRKKSEFIIANAPTPIIDLKPDLSITYANHAFAVLTDKSIEEIQKMKVTDFDVRNRAGGSLAEGIETKSQVHGDLDAVVASGTKHLQYYYTPFFAEDGNLLSIFAYYIDKTEEKNAVRDIIALTEQSQAGSLDARVDPAPYSGELKLLMEGINGTLDSIISPLNVAAEYVDRISKGDLPPRITEEYNGDFNEIKNNLNNCIDAIHQLISDAGMLSVAAVEGRLETRADVTKHLGDYRKIVEGINNSLDAVITPLRDAGAVLERMAVNDHTKAMDESAYLGDFVSLASNINAVRDRVNHIAGSIEKISHGDLSELAEYRQIGRRSEQDRIVPGFIKAFENLQALTRDTTMLVDAASQGNFNVRADVSRHEGEYRRIIEGINATVDTIADKVAWFESILDAIPFPVSVTDLNMNWTFLNPATAKMANVDKKQAIGTQCNRWNANICRTKDCGIECLRAGKRETFFEQEGGFFKVDVGYVKDASGKDIGHVEVIQDITAIKKVEKYLDESVRNISYCLGMFANGKTDFEVRIPESDQYTDDVRKKIVDLTVNLHRARDSVKNLVVQAKSLAKGAIQGDLKNRADITQVTGDFAEVLSGINDTLESVVTPVQEAIRVANEYANANFSARVDSSLKVAGDWVGFKTALDNIGIQICDAIGAINKQILELASNAEEATASVEEVSAGAQQIARNTGSVSANAEQGDDGITQVLKAMEDLTITVGEVSQRAEKVSHSATEANQFSKEGIDLAKKSESAMKGITGSTSEVDQIVREINQQMEEIGKIVRLITDISNQTNLLALNAAIEAARAGEAGRGFAVVAAEVKSLAQDSRASAENIADMIANLQAKAKKANDAIIAAGTAVEDGNHALEETVSAFTKIAESIEDITRNAMDMASSSEEQAASVEEITASVNEVSVLIQGTAREAQDAAAATEEASASIEQIGRVVANVSGIAESISREMTKFKI